MKNPKDFITESLDEFDKKFYGFEGVNKRKCVGLDGVQTKEIKSFLKQELEKASEVATSLAIDSLEIPEVDEVIVSRLEAERDSVGNWVKVSRSDEALFGWNEARKYLEKLKKEKK